MKKQLDCPSGPTPANAVGLSQYYGLLLLVCLFAVLSACTANRTDSATGQRMRLTVGDIKEITIAARQDTTYQLTATSDNQEVVDVSRRPSDPAAPKGPQLPTAGPVVFLIKGVTAGTAKVVFTENRIGAEGSGQVKKAYVVTVANK